MELTLVTVLSLLAASVLGVVLGVGWARRGMVTGTLVADAERGHAVTQSQLEGALAQLDAERARTEVLANELQQARERYVGLETQHAATEKRLTEQQQSLNQFQEQALHQFKTLSEQIFQEKTVQFKQQAQEGLGTLLNPLRERLQEFQKKVDESFGNQAKEQFALKHEIERIVSVNQQMSLQAENLTKALKGDVKLQGNWGEIILEKILEESGLRPGLDYIVQGEGLGLKDDETGRHLRPDVIVNLPEQTHVIIDSKVSLTHYERYCSEEDPVERAKVLKQFIGSIKSHVVELEQRRYQDAEKLGTPDFVLMFIPIEGAFALAVQHEQALHSFAWDKKIAIVCPSTLFVALKTIASFWRVELQNRNALEIARRGGDLYNKIAGYVEDMERLGAQLKTCAKTYESAMGKLSQGKGNIISRTEQLRQLGARVSKNLPTHLLDEEQAE